MIVVAVVGRMTNCGATRIRLNAPASITAITDRAMTVVPIADCRCLNWLEVLTGLSLIRVHPSHFNESIWLVF